MKRFGFRFAALFLALALLLCGTAFGEGLDEAGIAPDFETLQAAVPGAILLDAPEGAQDVLYRWIADEQLARIQFDLDGESFMLSAKAGRLSEDESIDGDFGDVSQYVPTEGGIRLRMSEAFAAAEGYSAANDTSYALMGPGEQSGETVLALAAKLFPEDCE